MAGKLLLPDSRFRSPTAQGDVADVRDDNIYSAIVANHNGQGQVSLFTVPQGQAIPLLGGTARTAANIPAHHNLYTLTTTNLIKAGELGSNIGDVAVRAIGATIEAGAYDVSGALRAYGAGQQEVAELMAKTAFRLRVGQKDMVTGPLWMYPGMGGPANGLAFGSGSASSTGVRGMVTNGWPVNQGRKLKLSIQIARTDTIEGVYQTAAALSFSVTSDPGQPCLVWFSLHAIVKGDVR